MKMIANRCSSTLSEDEDSVLQIHTIHDSLSIRSLARNDSISAMTEDDELQNEIDMLSFAEREVSQEIAHSDRLFSNQSNDKATRTDAAYDRKRFNSKTPKMKSMYTESTKQKTKILFEELTIPRNEEKMHSTLNKNGNSDMIMNDTRESPHRSRPSDEESVGIFGISTREPPEEIVFVDDEESDPTIVPFVVTHQTRKQLNNVDESFAESIFIDRNGCGFSYWSLRSLHLSDTEKGADNLFEQDGFWEEGFWKTPLFKHMNNLNPVPKRQTRLSSKRKKVLLVSRPQEAIIDKLSLPTLGHQKGGERSFDTGVAHETLTWRRDIPKEELDKISSKSDACRSINHSTESLDNRVPPVSSAQVIPRVHKIQSKYFGETLEKNPILLTHSADLSNEGEGMIAVNKETSQQFIGLCNWRMIVLTIEVVLTVIGGAILWLFLRSKHP